MISAARTVAFDILLDVERGGYASDLLDARTRGLDPRDAGLAHQIVMGVLRYRAQLDHLCGARKLDIEVRTALRMGIFQLRHLDRIPAHAAVGESVELVKRAKKRSATGLVNAVLRRIPRGEIAWPSREVELSCPEWLLARWERHFGRELAEGIARAALHEPEHFVRAPQGGPGLEPTEIPGCFYVPAGSDAARYRTQDIGSQAVVPHLQLAATHRMLDLCAAPGGKTAQALESGARAVACDLHFHRIAQLRGLGAQLLQLNGTQPLPFRPIFDRILLDAPCSGTGTLGRNPEIKWRLRESDLADLQSRQRALLAQARTVLAPGGRIVYSTCSLEPEENQQVAGPGLYRVPGRERGDGFFTAVVESQ